MKIPSTKSNKLALIYGILLGDGCLSKVGSKHYFISIAGSIRDDLPFFQEKVVPLLKEFVSNNIKIQKRIKQRELHICFTNRKLFEFLVKIGFPIGKKGTKVKIPDYFSKKYIKNIVKGYFATDGSLVITNNNGTKYPRIEFSSISKPLLLQVLDYLQSIGMKGACYTSKIYSNPHWNPHYRIQFNGKNNLKIFRKKIGFVNPKHPIKYQKWKKNAGGDI